MPEKPQKQLGLWLLVVARSRLARLQRSTECRLLRWLGPDRGVPGPVQLTVGVVLAPVLNLSESFQINCVKRW